MEGGCIAKRRRLEFGADGDERGLIFRQKKKREERRISLNRERDWPMFEAKRDIYSQYR